MIYLILFLFGLVFGSFGSVLMYRLGDVTLLDIREGNKKQRNKIKSVLFGRSYCPHCKKTLEARNLFPVLSYVMQKGKCDSCGVKIGYIYPLLEIGSGLLFVFSGYIGIINELSAGYIILLALVNWALYLLMIYDIKTNYLHEIIWLFLAILIVFIMGTGGPFMWYNAVQRGVFFLLFFLLLYKFAQRYVFMRRKKKGEGLGSGDVWLSGIIGFLFGIVQYWGNGPESIWDTLERFQYYIIIAGLLGLLYYAIIKMSNMKENTTPKQQDRENTNDTIDEEIASHEIPFFPGMIISLRILMALISFNFL